METTFTLELGFINQLGKSKSLSIKSPELNLTEEVVKEAMTKLCLADAFEKDDVALFVTPSKARYVERTVQTIFE